MSRKLFKVLILGAMVVSALASASSASATNWTSNGSSSGSGTPFTATAPTAKLTIASPSGPGTVCTSVSATGGLLGPTGPVNTGPWNGVSKSLAPAFSGCTIAGLAATVTCTTTDWLNVATQSGSVLSGGIDFIGCGITRGACTITIGGGPAAPTGTVSATYDNSTFKLTVLASGQSLPASAPAACDSITGFSGGGIAASTFGSNTTPIGNLVYTVTSTFKPNIQHN